MRIKRGIEIYLDKTNSGDDLGEVLLNGNRNEWEVDWEKWVKGLNGIVYGIVGGAVFEVIQEVSERFSLKKEDE